MSFYLIPSGILSVIDRGTEMKKAFNLFVRKNKSGLELLLQEELIVKAGRR